MQECNTPETLSDQQKTFLAQLIANEAERTGFPPRKERTPVPEEISTLLF